MVHTAWGLVASHSSDGTEERYRDRPAAVALAVLEAVAVTFIISAIIIERAGVSGTMSSWSEKLMLAGIVSLLLAPAAALAHLGVRFALRGSWRCAWFALATLGVTILGIYLA